MEYDIYSIVSRGVLVPGESRCFTCGDVLHIRPAEGSTRGALEVNGVWCPGCFGHVCEHCMYERHGAPVAKHDYEPVAARRKPIRRGRVA